MQRLLLLVFIANCSAISDKMCFNIHLLVRLDNVKEEVAAGYFSSSQSDSGYGYDQPTYQHPSYQQPTIKADPHKISSSNFNEKSCTCTDRHPWHWTPLHPHRI
ncbi:hypothetical protein Aduo_013949 [Ancylostoma duodenale]